LSINLSESPVICRIDSGIAYLTLNRPNKSNALDELLVDLLIQYLNELNDDSTVSLIFMTANGSNFCAGLDFNWVNDCIENNVDSYVAKTSMLFEVLNSSKKPLATFAQGAVYGGGIALLACSDIVIGFPNTTLCFSEVNIGLVPALLSPYVIQMLGLRQSTRYFLSGEMITAKRALSLGFLHEIYEENSVKTAINIWENKFNLINFQALPLVKKLLNIYKKVDNDLCTETQEILFFASRSELFLKNIKKLTSKCETKYAS
jgi:methylglutaconyl-CoA hydratase